MTAKQPKAVYRYQIINARTIELLCHDMLYFADPSSFNDPFDCKPTVISDSDSDTLRKILWELIKRRVTAETLALLKSARIQGGQAKEHASQVGEQSARWQLINIGYHANNPEHRVSKEVAEQRLLASAIERELLKQYDRGVCCFSAHVSNPLLWSHYGDHHRGVCIGYGLDRNPKPELHKVIYGGSRIVKTNLIAEAVLDNDQEAKKNLDRDMLLRKAPEWDYECEWRMLNDRGLQDSPLKLIDVTFGLRCPVGLMHAVISALENRAVPVKFFEIHEVPEAFELRRKLVDTDELHAFLPSVARSGIEIFGSVDSVRRSLSNQTD